MNPNKLQWKVGLFVAACLFVLAMLVLNFSKGLTFFTPTYTLNLRTANVGGIKREASVLMAGVQVGTVNGADLGPGGTNVIVSLKILSRYQIHRDAVFTIDSMGFLGDAYIAIIPGRNEAPLLRDHDEVVCREPFNLQEVARSAVGFIHRVDETAGKLDAAISLMQQRLLSEENLTNVAAGISAFRQASERASATMDELDRLIRSNTAPVGLAATNLTLFSGQLTNLAADLQQLVSANRADWTAAVKNIESSSRMMKSLLTELQAGKGLAGSLLKNEEWSVGFSQLLSNMTALSSNLNSHGLLWRPRKADSKPPPLYPGRDPRR